MNGYPISPLQRILSRAQDAVQINPEEVYKQVTVRLFHKGVVLRGEQPGAAIRTTRQFRVRAGQVLLSRIDARNGAIGLVPSELEDAVVTNDFWAFNVDRHLADPRFIDLYVGTGQFVEACQRASEGTTNRVRLQPERFLQIEVPLPPLPEQRRIVARLDQLSTRIGEARALRQHATEEAESIFNSLLTARFDSSGWPLKQLPDVAEIARGRFGYRPRNEPRFYGGNIPFIQIGDISSSNRYIRSNCQTLNKEGLAISRMFPAGTVAIAITGATIGVTGILGFDSCFPDSIVGIQAKPELTTPEFIYFAVENAKKTALAEATQTTQPNINLGNLQRLKVRVAPLSEQRRMVAELDALQVKVDALKRLQAESATELDALMPSILSKAFSGQL